MRIAVDLDKTLLSYPKFFHEFFKSMQSTGHQVGILTSRPQSDKEKNLKILNQIGIKPDFFVGIPDDLREQKYPMGIFKAKVCLELEVDVLFDDFQASDVGMIADFFTVNDKTIPFTSWGYKNVVDPNENYK